MTKAIPLPSQERLQELFDYSIVEGNFYWRKSGPGRKMGVPAGYAIKGGYRQIGIGKSQCHVGRLAWMYVTGEDPGDLVVDHIDGDPTNNAFHNLQLLTYQQNNSRKHKVWGASKYRGVSKSFKKWSATVAGNLHGTYDREIDAAHVAYLYSHHVYHVGYSNYKMPT